MSEPIQTPPADPGQAPTPPNPTEQAPQNQTPAGTPPVAPPAATPLAGTPPIPPSPELEALRLEAEQLRRQNLEAQRKITQQGQYISQTLNAPAHQEPADPLKPFIDTLKADGYDEKDARSIGKGIQKFLEPMMAQQQQAAAAIQSTAMVDDVMREAWGRCPQPFSNPQVAQRVQQQLKGDALAGRPIDAEYAFNLALMEDGRLRYAPPVGSPPPQQQAPPPNFNSMWSPPGGYQAPAAPAPARQPSAAVQRMSDDIRAEFFPKKQA